LSVGAKAGIGVGVAVAGLILAAILIFFFCCGGGRRRQRRGNAPVQQQGDSNQQEQVSAQPNPASPSDGKAESFGPWSSSPPTASPIHHHEFSTVTAPAAPNPYQIEYQDQYQHPHPHLSELPSSPISAPRAEVEAAGTASPPLQSSSFLNAASRSTLVRPESSSELSERQTLMNRHSQLEIMKKRMMDIQQLEEEQHEISERLRLMEGLPNPSTGS
jgi:hypothetical protein